MATNDEPFIDARGMHCPWPALRVARAMRDHAIVTIRADDPQAERELGALADQRGWRFVVTEPCFFRLERSA